MNQMLETNQSKTERVVFGCVAGHSPKYLFRALYLLRSIRWFGGTLSDADVMICVADDIHSILVSDYLTEFERLGALIRIVPPFNPGYPHSNKLRFFEQAEITEYDIAVLLDCDTILVQDPTPHLSHENFRAKIADLPTVSLQTFARLCDHFGLAMPEPTFRTTFDNVPTIWYCNSGVLVFPVHLIPRLVPIWCEYSRKLQARIELLGPSHFNVGQASLALAYLTNPIPFEALNVNMNFPLHLTHHQTPPEIANGDPVILHYHDCVDDAGYLLPSPYLGANARINQFNGQLRSVRGIDASKG